MKEYTVLAVLSVFLTFLLDRISATKLLKNMDFYFFLFAMLMFMLLVNGYITWAGIVRYHPGYISGVVIGSIPCEDLLFGFSMVTSTIVFWELLKKRRGT